MLQKWKMQYLSFGFGFTALSRLFHLFRADRKSEVGETGVPGEETLRLGVSHVTRAMREPRNVIQSPFSDQPSLRYI